MPDTRSSWFIYLIRCGDGSLYTGIATDVDRRLNEHKSGKRGAKYLRGRKPLRLVFRCRAVDRSEASRIESQIKKLSREQKEALVAGSLTLEGVQAPQAAPVVESQPCD